MNLFSHLDDPDEDKRKRLTSMGWRKVESRGEPYPRWETADGKRFTEEEAFALLDKINKEPNRCSSS